MTMLGCTVAVRWRESLSRAGVDPGFVTGGSNVCVCAKGGIRDGTYLP